MIELEMARKRILAFIQSKMSHVAPNLSELVGTEVKKKTKKKKKKN
jgi:RNA processing factor Prp31